MNPNANPKTQMDSRPLYLRAEEALAATARALSLDPANVAAIAEHARLLGRIGRGEELAEIGILKPEDALSFAIVTIPEDARRMTANLQGPLILNRETRTGRQCISGDPRWQVRHLILAELQR